MTTKTVTFIVGRPWRTKQWLIWIAVMLVVGAALAVASSPGSSEASPVTTTVLVKSSVAPGWAQLKVWV